MRNAVSSDTVQRLLGHCIVVMVLNRSGMGIFRSAYDFASRGYRRSGLIPLLVSDMRQPWSNTITVTDASPEGFGICEGEFESSVISKVGQWQERWRYKRLPIEEWAPRRRTLGLDPSRTRTQLLGMSFSRRFQKPFSILISIQWR